jgi:hypothetical protein
MFVEKIYKMGCLEGSGVTVLYIGRTVSKGYVSYFNKLLIIKRKRDLVFYGMKVCIYIYIKVKVKISHYRP